MEALIQLSDLISEHPDRLSDKLAWICTKCPPARSPRITQQQLNALLALSRLLSKSPKLPDPRPKSLIIDFLKSIPDSFSLSFWPQSCNKIDSISAFYTDFLGYIVKATDLNGDFAEDVARFIGEIVILVTSYNNNNDDAGISRVFLIALSMNCPSVLSEDADRLVSLLLKSFSMVSTKENLLISESVESGSSHSSPYNNGKHNNNGQVNDSSSSIAIDEASNNNNGSPSSSNLESMRSPGSSVNGGGSSNSHSIVSLEQSSGRNVSVSGNDAAAMIRQQVASFEEEGIDYLEKQAIALRLTGHIVDKVPVRPDQMNEIRLGTKKLLQSAPIFLKIRKRDWTEEPAMLRTRIVAKLSVYQAAVSVQIKTLASLDSDAKILKKNTIETLTLFLDVAESCLSFYWRKFKVCEELFSFLLKGIAKIAITRGGQLLQILFIRLKPLVVTACAQADTMGGSQGALFSSVIKTSSEIAEFGWSKDQNAVETFIVGLATHIRERSDYEEQEDKKEKQTIPVKQLNIIRLLADMNVSLNKSLVVDMVLPLFIESLEEGEASTPNLLRLQLLNAVSHMASLGFEKSYRETVVLMTRSYTNKLAVVGSVESKTLAPEATTERVETLPAGFLLIAHGLTNPKLRLDYRHRLLSLCSDVGLAAESNSGRSGADFLGPLLPAVAEVCSDLDPTAVVEPSLLKLFRNLWFYIALFGLAPPIQKNFLPSKSISTTLNSVGSISGMAFQAVAGPYMYNVQWSEAVQRIAQGTPPLVVSSVKWLEDELELNALHNPGSRRGSGNEKAALVQKAALSAALGGQVEIGAMGAISGVKATYLLAVAFLEIIRFSSNGGILNGDKGSLTSRSAFSCVFEYLKTPNLLPAVTQCLNAIIQSSFETAVSWMGDRVCETGNEAELRELTLSAHACFLIKSMSERDEHIRDISASLLTQLKDRFPQVLWNSSCLDSLLFSVDKDLPPSLVNDPAWVAKVRSLYKRVIQEWITNALSYAPCTSQGLLQEKLCQANAWRTPQSTTDVVSLLSEIRLGSGKTDCWSGIRTANIPAVMAAAGAASGGNFKLVETFNLEVLSTGIVSASYKCNVSGEISGMRGLYNSMGGLGFGLGRGLQMWRSGVSGQEPQAESQSFNALLLAQFVQELQQYVNTAEKGGDVDKSSFRQTCSKATALLLSDLGPDSRPNIEGFSQLLRLLCWCPAYISTPDAMETGVYIWTWLVSAAPQLGSLVLAELVDAWLWTIDTKRGLFAHEMKFSGPAAKLRPHLAPGEPELPPDKDPVEGIIAHRLWLGFFIDRFEVTRHGSVEQLMLLGRLLQGTMKIPSHFSRHPAASGTFFTVMLLGLKYCSCQSQANLQDFRMGLQLLEDRVYRASLGWFANEPEWYDRNNRNFSLHEAQSMSLFIHFLQNEHTDVIQSDSLPKGRESGGSFHDLKDQYHPVWGKMDNYAAGKEKRKQLLLMLCQHQADRLDVWANPTTAKENTLYKLKFNTEKWIEYARTAFSVDPRIALSLVSRFPAVSTLRAEITQLVQTHITEIRHIPEALPFFVTPKAVEENSPILQQLPHWAACSITQALQFLTPAYKGHLRVMAYVLRVLESYPPVSVKEYMPQLVQALRYDDEGLVEGYLFRAANRSDIFAHILIWNLQGETSGPEEGKDTSNGKNNLFQSKLPAVRQRIVDGFSQKALDIFEREFDFFDKVTSISGVLFPLPKEERRAGIRRELEKIEVNGDDLYLPTAPNKLVRGIRLDSGIPLQSAAKVPIMITFNVMDRGGSEDDIKPQACIFKVGDDCRQDVLALQVISLLRDIFEAVGINLYLFPYGVLPTGPERGIIEVVPNTRSRSQMGEINDGGLYEIFQQDFGSVGSPTFEAARDNFIISSAGYAVASLLLQPKDRHNGNLLFDNVGRLVHIDFGFILETSPGGNMRFESAHFKLSHEMTQLLDPSGAMKSETWTHFTSLCVKGYLAARLHMDGIINTVQLMVDSGLPCFGRGDPIGNLRKRLHPEMSEREAAIFMIRTCTDAYNKWTTAGYDLIQYLQQGIEK